MTLWKYEACTKQLKMTCLEARIQCCNKWMPRSKDQSFLFTDGVSHTATTDNVRLLNDFNGKTLVSSV